MMHRYWIVKLLDSSGSHKWCSQSQTFTTFQNLVLNTSLIEPRATIAPQTSERAQTYKKRSSTFFLSPCSPCSPWFSPQGSVLTVSSTQQWTDHWMDFNEANSVSVKGAVCKHLWHLLVKKWNKISGVLPRNSLPLQSCKNYGGCRCQNLYSCIEQCLRQMEICLHDGFRKENLPVSC